MLCKKELHDKKWRYSLSSYQQHEHCVQTHCFSTPSRIPTQNIHPLFYPKE